MKWRRKWQGPIDGRQLTGRNAGVNTRDNSAIQKTLRALFDAALGAADPARAIALHLPQPVAGRTVVVGAGKASAAMASAFEKAWSGPPGKLLEGLVVTRHGHAVPCRQIEIVEAAHPVPDPAGEAVAGRVLDLGSGVCREGQHGCPCSR